jgi:hypothetical protein
MAQLAEIAEMSDEILTFYQMHWDNDVLLGCILPRRAAALPLISDAATRALVMDAPRNELLRHQVRPADRTTDRDDVAVSHRHVRQFSQSGAGNKGLRRRYRATDRGGIEPHHRRDEYIASMQPATTTESRCEQGVTVSMVDESGMLVPEQRGRRSVLPCPTLIRRGLDCDRVMDNLAATFPSWDHRQGTYH